MEEEIGRRGSRETEGWAGEGGGREGMEER